MTCACVPCDHCRRQEEPLAFEDLLQDGFEVGPSRSAINGNNSRRHGLSQTDEWNPCKGLLRRLEPGFVFHDGWPEFWHLVRYVRDVVGHRPTALHHIGLLVEDEGVVPGNLMWVDTSERPEVRQALQEAADAVWLCLCDDRLREGCPCPRGVDLPSAAVE